MIDLSAFPMVSEALDGAPGTGWGYIVVAVILVPMLLLILAAIFSQPRDGKITMVFIGCVGLLVVMILAGAFVIGALLGLFMP